MKRLVPALWLLCACDDFASLARLKPRKLTVHVHDVHLVGGSQLQVPMPTSAPPIEAWVRPDAGSEWVHATGEWKAEGECELFVAPGFTLLSRDGLSNLVEVEGDDVDLGREQLGPVRALAPSGTSVTFDVRGAVAPEARTLAPVWLPQSELAVSNFNPLLFAPTPPIDVREPGRFTITYDWQYLPLLEAADGFELFQANAVDAGSGATRWTLESKAAGTVSPVAGRTITAAQVTLAPLPDAGTPVAGFTYDFTKLAPLIAEGVMNGRVAGVAIEVTAATHGLAGQLPVQILSARQAMVLESPAVTVDPLPGVVWEPRVGIRVDYASIIELTGGDAIAVPLTLTLSSTRAAFTVSEASLVAPVGVIRAFRDDGSEVEGTELGTLTPLLTWEPTLGRANRYYVAPIEVQLDPKHFEPGTLMQVNGERCAVPPGLLERGRNYTFLIIAENCGAAPASAPYRETEQSTCATAQARSLMFRTPEQ